MYTTPSGNALTHCVAKTHDASMPGYAPRRMRQEPIPRRSTRSRGRRIQRNTSRQALTATSGTLSRCAMGPNPWLRVQGSEPSVSLRQQIGAAVFEEMRSFVGPHRGANAFGGQHFEQQGARYATIDDVNGPHAFAHGLQCGSEPRSHPALHDLVAQQRVRLAGRHDVGELAVTPMNAWHVGHQNELLGL